MIDIGPEFATTVKAVCYALALVLIILIGAKERR